MTRSTFAMVLGLATAALGAGGWQAADTMILATTHCTGLACSCTCHAHAIAGVSFAAVQGVLGTMMGLGVASALLGGMSRLTTPAMEPVLG